MTTTSPWWRADDGHDRDHASDRFSRYGAYLAQRLDRAIADGDTGDPSCWVAWCWRVASHPVMAPGYVEARDPIQWAALWHDHDTGRLTATVVAAAPLPDGLGRRWRTWHPDLRGRLTHGASPAALTRIQFETPLDEPAGGWPAPPDLPCGRPQLVAAAKSAVGVAATALNHNFGPDLATLAEGLYLAGRPDRGLTRA